MSQYKKWAHKEHSLGKRIAATLPVGLILILLFPYLMVTAGPALDRQLGLPSFQFGLANYIAGGLLLVVGLFFGFWSNLVQFDLGRGTPLPMLPTRELLVVGPFRYCRNPMTLGTILVYAGVGVAAGTISGLGFALCFILLLMFYLKRFEEKELAERFGEAYLRYKREVPFMIPRVPRRK